MNTTKLDKNKNPINNRIRLIEIKNEIQKRGLCNFFEDRLKYEPANGNEGLKKCFNIFEDLEKNSMSKPFLYIDPKTKWYNNYRKKNKKIDGFCHNKKKN